MRAGTAATWRPRTGTSGLIPARKFAPIRDGAEEAGEGAAARVREGVAAVGWRTAPSTTVGVRCGAAVTVVRDASVMPGLAFSG